jgi:hypothetical protein
MNYIDVIRSYGRHIKELSTHFMSSLHYIFLCVLSSLIIQLQEFLQFALWPGYRFARVVEPFNTSPAVPDVIFCNSSNCITKTNISLTYRQVQIIFTTRKVHISNLSVYDTVKADRGVPNFGEAFILLPFSEHSRI